MKKNFSSIIFGLVLVAAGVGWIGDIFEVWDISTIFFDGWWTLFIIIPSVTALFKKDLRILGIIGTVIGSLLLLNEQNVKLSENALKSIVPVVIIITGLSIVFTGLFGKENKISKARKATIKKGNSNHSTVFSDVNHNYAGTIYDGGNCTSIFGDLTLDLRNAQFNRDVKIDCFVAFGDIELLLPPYANVVVDINPVFSDVKNSFVNLNNQNVPTILICGNCIFGDIKLS